MCKLKPHRGSFSSLLSVCLLCFVYFLWVAPSAAESFSLAKADLTGSQNFTVSTNDGFVSVKATEASLKDVIERIGHALGIEVEAQVGDQEKVTVEFQDLTLDQAMERLSGNYAYTTDSDGSSIKKLFVFPKGEAVPADHSLPEKKENEVGRRASTAEPFKFQFDPGKFMREGQ